MAFLYSHWLALPLSTRAEIASKFGIAKTGPTHVFDNRIQSDGYAIQDVENALGMEALQTFVGSKETDMNVLFTKLVDIIEGRESFTAPTQEQVDAALEVAKEETPKMEEMSIGSLEVLPEEPKEKKKRVVKKK